MCEVRLGGPYRQNAYHLLTSQLMLQIIISYSQIRLSIIKSYTGLEKLGFASCHTKLYRFVYLNLQRQHRCG
jgi:hypothetical protein